MGLFFYFVVFSLSFAQTGLFALQFVKYIKNETG